MQYGIGINLSNLIKGSSGIGGIDSYTKLMLHMDGSNGSTTFTDSELTPKTVTAVGNAKISTAQSKFGGASGLFDGTGDRLTTVDSADFSFGTGDFTVDFWYYDNVSTGYQPGFCGQYADASNYWTMYGNATNETISVIFTIGGVVKARYVTATPTWTLYQQWNHIAYVRNGTNFYIFVNGVSATLTTVTAISTNDVGDVAAVLQIADDGQGEVANGYIDEFRVSKGIARWTSNFTPPTSAYTI